MIVIAVSFPFFLICDHYNQPFRGLLLAMSIGMVTSLIFILKPISRSIRFWSTLAAIFALHMGMVYFFPYTGTFRFGFALFPIFLIDAYISARLLIFACGAKL
jgi:hypothetical protein